MRCGWVFGFIQIIVSFAGVLGWWWGPENMCPAPSGRRLNGTLPLVFVGGKDAWSFWSPASLPYSQGCLIITFRRPQCPRHSIILCRRKNGIRLNGQDRQGLCHQHLQQLLNGEPKISLSQQQLARPISCLSFCKNPIRGDLLTSTKAGVTGNMGRGGIAG